MRNFFTTTVVEGAKMDADASGDFWCLTNAERR
jgi:hypothetical protein